MPREAELRKRGELKFPDKTLINSLRKFGFLFHLRRRKTLLSFKVDACAFPCRFAHDVDSRVDVCTK